MRIVDRIAVWFGHRLLEREIRRANREDNPIFADGGPIEGGAVAYGSAEDFAQRDRHNARIMDRAVDVTDIVDSWNIKPFPPAIEDSPALNAEATDENGDAAWTLDGTQRAIDQTVRFGQTIRRCDECGSFHTEHEVAQWVAIPHATDDTKLVVACDVHEQCNSCGHTGEFRVVPAAFVALKAASAMAQAELAMDGLRLELGIDDDA